MKELQGHEPALRLSLDKIGKKFYNRWLFKSIQATVTTGEKLVLIGGNGSGKSTLLRIISGQLRPNEGSVSLDQNGIKIPLSQFYKYLSWAGPSISYYSDLSCQKQLNLHFSFKPCIFDTPQTVLKELKLIPHADKPLRYFSSGMLQRFMLGLSLFSQSELLLLDEPTSNMDASNAAFMLELIEQYRGEKICVLASNMERDIFNSDHTITLGKSSND